MIQDFAAAVTQAQQERREHVLEGVATAEDPGLGKQRTGRVALEGLDEPGVARIVKIGLDRPGPGIDGAPRQVGGVRVEAEGRAKGRVGTRRGVERDQPRGAAPVAEGDHGIRGAEINTDGQGGAHEDAPHRAFSPRRIAGPPLTDTGGAGLSTIGSSSGLLASSRRRRCGERSDGQDRTG